LQGGVRSEAHFGTRHLSKILTEYVEHYTVTDRISLALSGRLSPKPLSQPITDLADVRSIRLLPVLYSLIN
jgi:hypothetical protein